MGVTTEDGYIILLVIAVIVVIVVVYIFRHPGNGELSQEDATSLGYGYFADAVLGECITQSHPGFCTETGTQTSTRACISHSDTGRGCLDSDGNETYKSQVDLVPCVPMCRSSIWDEEEVSGCLILTTSDEIPFNVSTSQGDSESPYDVCLQEGAQGFRQKTRTCLAMDATGPNQCTYDYPFGSKDPIPEGCRLNSVGTTVSCQVGTTIQVTEACNLDESLIEERKCGLWKVSPKSLPRGDPREDQSGERLEDGTGIYELCLRSPITGQVSECRNQEGELYSSDLDILKSGWFSQSTKCIQSGSDNPAYGCRQPECVPQSEAFEAANANVGGAVYVCQDPNSSIPSPGCLQPCQFYPDDLQGGWSQPLKDLVLKLGVAYTQSNANATYVLGINNIPCPDMSQGGQFLDGASPDLFPLPLGDCFGDPRTALNDTPSLFIQVDQILDDPDIYGLSLNCNRSTTIITQSGYYLLFLPTREFSGDPNTMYCSITAIIGKDYMGVLTITDGTLSWSQAPLGDRSDTEFKVVYSQSTDIFSVTQTDDTPIQVDSNGGDNQIFDLSSLTFTGQTGNFDKLHSILSARQTRNDPENCNVMYTYPPPAGYPNPDVSDL